MYRSHLEKHHGMLFVFEQEQYVSMWMKNTTIALDILWLDKDYKILCIKKGQPLSKKTLHCQKKATYILELKQNETNFRPGKKLTQKNQSKQ